MSKYEVAVAEARQLITRSEADQWRLAELTFEQCRPRQGAVTKAQWSRDIGVGETTVALYYRLGERWSPHARVDRPAYSDAYNMINEGGSTPEEARENKSARQATSAIRKATPERQAEIVRELVQDNPIVAAAAEEAIGHPSPEAVKRAVIADPVAAVAASQALEQRQAAAPAPRVRDRSKDERFTQAMVAMRGADKQLRAFADAASGGEWTDTEAAAFEGALDSMVSVIGIIRTALRSGSWDAELAKLTDAL